MNLQSRLPIFPCAIFLIACSWIEIGRAFINMADSTQILKRRGADDSFRELDSLRVLDLIERKVKFDAQYSNLYAVKLDEGESVTLVKSSSTGLHDTVRWAPVMPQPRSDDESNANLDSATVEVYLHFAYIAADQLPSSAKTTIVPLRALRVQHKFDVRLYVPDTTVVPETTDVGFKDFYAFAQSDKQELYSRIVDFLRSLPPERVILLRTVPTLGRLPFRGTDLGNADYRNYVAVHSTHRYEKATTTKRVQGKGRIALGESDVAVPYYLDVALYPLERISFSADVLSSQQGLGILGFGFEVGIEDKVLSMLSYQIPYLRVLGRLLFTFSGNTDNIGNDYFVDLKVGGRIARTLWKPQGFFRPEQWILNYDTPKLNVTDGTIFEANLGRVDHRLPFINLFLSPGTSDYSSPLVSIDIGSGMRGAYFSKSQWEVSLAYFWNTDRERMNRFRFDVGAGAYRVDWATFDLGGKLVSPDNPEQVQGLSSVQALLSLDYTHSSNSNIQLFGMKLRWFDSRVTVGSWLKILRFEEHEVRLGATYLTGSLGRILRPWEGSDAFRMQLRYRLGF